MKRHGLVLLVGVLMLPAVADAQNTGPIDLSRAKKNCQESGIPFAPDAGTKPQFYFCWNPDADTLWDILQKTFEHKNEKNNWGESVSRSGATCLRWAFLPDRKNHISCIVSAGQ